MHYKPFNGVLLICLFLACIGAAPLPTSPATGFVHASGQQIIDPQGQTIFLRGTNFSNRFWENKYSASTYASKGFYQQLHELGMNTIRFDFSYRTMQGDAPAGSIDARFWPWIDQNIAWAKAAGIYMIINLHVAPGLDEGTLWTNNGDQQQTAALWKIIAARYKDEPIVAGYDLINEPMQVEKEQWQKLAQLLTDTIRSVDTHHMIVVEAINAYPRPVFVEVKDTNLMYDFHFYNPDDFAEADTGSFYQFDSYPDENRLMFNWDDLSSLPQTSSESLPSGTSDWKIYQSALETPGQANNLLGIPAIHCNFNGGKAYMGDLKIEAYDKDAQLVETARDIKIGKQIFRDFWTADGKGLFGMSPDNPLNTPDGRSLTLSNMTADTALDELSLAFAARTGLRYKISGWMKGENVSTGANCRLTIDWYQYKPAPELMVFNKAYLAHAVEASLGFAKQHNAPINVGEFGPNQSLLYGNRGGDRYLADVMDVLIENGLNFQIWDWLLNQDTMHYPDLKNLNQNVVQIFKEKLLPNK
jgi:endoglucanase